MNSVAIEFYPKVMLQWTQARVQYPIHVFIGGARNPGNVRARNAVAFTVIITGTTSVRFHLAKAKKDTSPEMQIMLLQLPGGGLIEMVPADVSNAHMLRCQRSRQLLKPRRYLLHGRAVQDD